MPMEWISVLLLLQLSGQFSPGSCGKVLVWPTEYSHWINMKTILDALVQRGHEVTVLTSSASILVDPNKPSAIQFEVFPTSVTKDDFEDLFNRLTSKLTYTPKYTFWTYYSQIQDNIWEYFDYIQKLCKEAVLNKKLMRKLQESRFDVVLADPSGPCGELLAELLKIPFVYSLRFSFGYTIEKPKGVLVLRGWRGWEPVAALVPAVWSSPYSIQVIWRYDGKKPDTLGPNTRLYKWIPQNDLLGIYARRGRLGCQKVLTGGPKLPVGEEALSPWTQSLAAAFQCSRSQSSCFLGHLAPKPAGPQVAPWPAAYCSVNVPICYLVKMPLSGLVLAHQPLLLARVTCFKGQNTIYHYDWALPWLDLRSAPSSCTDGRVRACNWGPGCLQRPKVLKIAARLGLSDTGSLLPLDAFRLANLGAKPSLASQPP
ncbi:UDP-glucuronosyltransferase 2B17 [Myotis davidii]|uniref:glucuronosyltransferase n=1 Tax=Myotis davidii TaxID=225400 RepID=L5MBM6_MYODS|nr:UDP-glucuronosyltransferase 2B17 [Myotis davidii]